jgi:hypothetical protein
MFDKMAHHVGAPTLNTVKEELFRDYLAMQWRVQESMY